jgi:hypothetical protein
MDKLTKPQEELLKKISINQGWFNLDNGKVPPRTGVISLLRLRDKGYIRAYLKIYKDAYNITRDQWQFKINSKGGC